MSSLELARPLNDPETDLPSSSAETVAFPDAEGQPDVVDKYRHEKISLIGREAQESMPDMVPFRKSIAELGYPADVANKLEAHLKVNSDQITQLEEAAKKQIAEVGSQEAKARESLPKNSLREFSRRYAPEARAETAFLIRKMRREARRDNAAIRQENLSKEAKTGRLRDELEGLGVREESLAQMIGEQQAEVAADKKKVGRRIMAFFGRPDTSGQETLDSMNAGLESLKAQMTERLQMLKELSVLEEETDTMAEGRRMLESFHQGQDADRNRLVAEESERSVANISEQQQAFFIHALAGDTSSMRNTHDNNATIDTKAIDLRTKLDLLVGLQPTLSVSTVREGAAEDATTYPFGVILKAGRVLSAYAGDAFTSANGAYSRKSKVEDASASSIQADFQENLTAAVSRDQEQIRSKQLGWHEQYNELVVEDPDIAGLYVDLNHLERGQGARGIDMAEIVDMAKERAMPLFGRKDGRMYILSEDGNWKEASTALILGAGQGLSDGQRLQIAERAVERSPFPISKEVVSRFDNYTLGASYYEYISRLAKGEQVVLDGVKVDAYSGYGGLKWEDDATQRTWYYVQESIRTTRDKEGAPVNTPFTEYVNDIPNGKYFSSKSEARPGDGPEGYVAFIGEALQILEEKIEESQEQGRDQRKRISLNEQKNQAISQLQGFADAAQKDGREAISDFALTELRKFDSSGSSERFARERVGADGSLQVLDTDIPAEVRSRLSELASSAAALPSQ